MFKKVYLISLYLFITTQFSISSDLYNFQFDSIKGGIINLENYSGKLVLLVNTASRCGYTNQYSGLQNLWETYKDRGFIVLGVPSNSFNQEMKDEERVIDFCETNFGINFPLTTIQKVTGKDIHPVYKWLEEEYSITPGWNFYKVLFDRNGKVITSYQSSVTPEDKDLIREIEMRVDNYKEKSNI